MLHTLLDAARLNYHIVEAKTKVSPTDYISLYKGLSEETLSEYGPYLFASEPASPFTRWFLENGWGKAWGVLTESSAKASVTFHHFRKFITVQTDAGQSLYFRFYDPRVLRTVLPLFNYQQLTDFFGPVRYFLLEDEDPALGHYFWLDKGELKRSLINHSDIIKTVNGQV